MDFKPKLTKRGKECQYILVKGAIQQEEITIISIYAPNTGTFNFIKRVLLDIKEQINIDTILVRDPNAPLTFEQIN